MKRQNRKRGFTMAEMLIVVAIIGVLAAVAFVAVNQHQRSLERLERDSVAREIFIAAQNHLTMAESQGYLGLSGDKIYGTQVDATKGTYYFTVNKGSRFSTTGAPVSLLDLMLPFGSIDETVRGGGSYIIHYQPKTVQTETNNTIVSSGTVIDVFYCSTDGRYGDDLSDTDVEGLKSLISKYAGDDKAGDRKNYGSAVLGWYGGTALEPITTNVLTDPLLYVENGNKLRVGVVDKNTGDSLQIIVKGITSGAETVIELRKSTEESFTPDATRIDNDNKVNNQTCSYVIILDDITTKGLHFSDLVADSGSFIPGEDITIQAKVFDNTKISNIAYSAEITVNSLFEKIEEGTKDNAGKIPVTAYVNNIRHLENLDKRVSNVTVTREEGVASNKTTYNLNSAKQTSDISWKRFKEDIKGKDNADTTVIYEHKLNTDDTPITTAGNYLPIRTATGTGSSYLTSYDGQYHSISDIKVDYAGNAGLLESVTGVSATPATIVNLTLIDFDVTNSGTGNFNAGALAGTLTYVDVTNVIAYNSKATITTGLVAKTGNGGGLIGSTSNCNITKSAASLRVTSVAGNAGGLIGETTDGKVSGCYSGGHTTNTAYVDYNVKSEATDKNAGGLIGSAISTPIDHSYSTCSATGAKVGGLVGSANGMIQKSYCTGLVKSTAATPVEGAFAGTWSYSSKTAEDDNHYFDIINEREKKDENENIIGYTSLYPVSDSENVRGISAIDYNTSTYNNFCGAPKTVDEKDYRWNPANPYDPKLIEYYSGRYNLKTIAQLDTSTPKQVDVIETATTVNNVTTPADFVATHYGDWPAPEIFVVNTK